MIKNIAIFFAITTLLVFSAKQIQAQFGGLDMESIKDPVVVELFTSQSCSSCPPADAILEELSQHDQVIALGCHVTYWDHLHWKDTLSRNFCTERQRAIAGYNKSRSVYTPQMVVNGRDEFVGSRRGQAGSSIESASNAKEIAPIILSASADKPITASLPSVRSKKPMTLWVFGTRRAHEQSIASGENRGRTVTYVHAVTYQNDLGSWNGENKNISLPIPKDQNIEELVVLAQEDGFGPIHAAGKISLKP